LNCRSVDQKKEGKKDQATASKPATAIPEDRKEIKKEPVAEYREKTDDPLNDWYFTVRLYETPKTFEYRLTMQFEEIRGEDTLRLPDFGIMPKPVLQKGKDKYSCIIGFLDKENKFLEYKKVYVKEGRQLKLVTLRLYSVTATPEQ
jgi:hypothetical protein